MIEPLLLIERPGAGPLQRPTLSALEETVVSDGLPNLSELGATVLRYDPPFYGDVDLIEIAPKNCTPRDTRLYYLHRDGKFHRLNGKSPPIHEVNAIAEVVITEATALDYLAFFCFFVRGDEGPFLIADRLENRYLPQMPNAAEFRGAFRKPLLYGQDQNNDWRASALVYYDDDLFFADFLIHLDGMIEMKRDVRVIESTGKQVNAPLDVVRVNS
jgi:hypothetical protein